MRRLLPCVAVLAAAIGACGPGGEERSNRSSRRPATPAPLIVSDDDLRLPRGCRPGDVGQLIQTFFGAINRGDPGAADLVDFGLAPGRGWFSVTDGDPARGGRHFVARTRPSLRRYLAARHLMHEVLRLREVTVSHSNGLGQIEYVVGRRADDLRSLGIRGSAVIGKGAISCARRRLVVWSMAMPAGEGLHPERLCRRPAGSNRHDAIACARRRSTTPSAPIGTVAP
jgi:hypothetical protein